jgi:3-phosphoshikimate 1-carboxyvinyltransferase
MVIAEVRPARRIEGRLRLPGDKSISHRYALLAALAVGETTIRGYAPGADCAATLACLRRLGTVLRHGAAASGEPIVYIAGRGLRGLSRPDGPLDAANSGTTMRLLAGTLAAHPFETTLTGDASLSRRPMRRVIEPLERMGARIAAADGRPPLTIQGNRLSGIEYRLPVASAQVKSAVLLAGLQAEGDTVVHEGVPTRDHTELAVVAFGGVLDRTAGAVTVQGGQPLQGVELEVPGDLSSGAFWLAAAAALPGSDLELLCVGLNPTRTRLLEVLRRAGARVDTVVETTAAGEPAGRVRLRHDRLHPIVVGPSEVPALIDELPALAALATFGGGLQVSGAGELRSKESDRISALVAGLRALGVRADEAADGFTIHPGPPPAGGAPDACGDHRLAMAFAIAALGATGPSRLRGTEAVAVSYPAFFAVLESIRREDR